MDKDHDIPNTNNKQVSPSDAEPRDSSAAKCITFELLGESTFGPEYTHQCFPGEFIPGYRPKQGNVVVETQQQRHASSFQHLTTRDELSIHIELSPSCETCSVSIDAVLAPDKREMMIKQQRQSASPSKKQKLNNGCDDVEESSVDLGSEDSETEEEDEVNDDDDDEPVVHTMTVEEIREQLAKFLPPIVEDAASQYLSQPFGRMLSEYSRKDMNFCLMLCDGKDCVDYHNKIQNLASFFIETADNVNVADEDDSWKVLYLFRKHANSKYSLVGYMTLYKFASPFRKPVAGIIVRVCQALVLPPYQRMGHGKTMLHAVFDWANDTTATNKDDMIVEINVEDPAPGFAMLRNVVDWERFQRSGRTWFGQDDDDSKLVDDAAFFCPLKESKALEVTALAKTTYKQVQIVYELDKLQRLQSRLLQTDIVDATDFRGVLEKRFRLMVKQRLNKQNREEICACNDKQAAKMLLGKMFDEVYGQYRAILKSVSRDTK